MNKLLHEKQKTLQTVRTKPLEKLKEWYTLKIAFNLQHTVLQRHAVGKLFLIRDRKLDTAKKNLKMMF